jgi:formylglycine-generating enzyme
MRLNKLMKIIIVFYIVTLMLLHSAADSIQPDKNMVFVEGGTFHIGDTFGDGESAEKPVHEVRVGSFWIGKFEVTQKEWIEMMEKNPSHFALKGLAPANLPVESVNWYDAIEYCNKRSIKEGLKPYYNIDKTKKDPKNSNEYDGFKWIVTINSGSNGYRIPTESEWEYACRGGIKSKGYKFSGSNNIDDVAKYSQNSTLRHPGLEYLCCEKLD